MDRYVVHHPAVQLQMPPGATGSSGAPRRAAVPCAARPSTGFVHLDGPCHCFIGGPPPEFSPSISLATDPGELMRRYAS